jgi:hypothetical protein
MVVPTRNDSANEIALISKAKKIVKDLVNLKNHIIVMAIV